MNKASIFVVIVMYSSRNSSSRPLYSVVNSAVHPRIQVASSLYEMGGPCFVQFITAFLNALKICDQNVGCARWSGKARK